MTRHNGRGLLREPCDVHVLSFVRGRGLALALGVPFGFSFRVRDVEVRGIKLKGPHDTGSWPGFKSQLLPACPLQIRIVKHPSVGRLFEPGDDEVGCGGYHLSWLRRYNPRFAVPESCRTACGWAWLGVAGESAPSTSYPSTLFGAGLVLTRLRLVRRLWRFAPGGFR